MPIRKGGEPALQRLDVLTAGAGSSPDEQALSREAIRTFHRRYYDSKVCQDTHWLGVETQKCPLDLWIYQEIIFGLREGDKVMAILDSDTARPTYWTSSGSMDRWSPPASA